MPHNKETLLVLDNVSFRYPQAKSHIFKSISIIINKGDRIGIIGGNGSGKSTLTKLILGIYKSHQGKILLFGRSPKWTNHFPKLGYIGDPGHNAEQLGLPTNLTIHQIVQTVCKLENIPHSNIHSNELILGLELTSLLNRKIAYLSTGERKRLMICLTFLRKPDFIILDEPFDGLDISIVEYISSLLQNSIKNGNITFFYIAHNIVEIDMYTNKVFLLKDGNLLPQPQRIFNGIEESLGNKEEFFYEKTGEVIGRMTKLMQSDKSNNGFTISLNPVKL